MPHGFKESHFIWLTIALIGLLVAGAFSEEIAPNLALQLLEYSSLALLLLSLLSLKPNRVWAHRFIVILGATVAIVAARGFTKNPYFEYAYLAALLVFLISAAWLVGSQVLLKGKVDLNIIVGSIALYLLLGLIWSIFYVILLEFSPTALKGIEAGAWHENMSSTTYFSFVTLTTLGYGDISPANAIGEVIVILEAVTGMFYLAIIVASLIGALRNK
jgi:voltage-gated potassium channel Kch